MTTTPENSPPLAATEPAAPASDRTLAETLYGLVGQDVDALFNRATVDERSARPQSERIAEAQLTLLQAIYHELRHGHDQVQRQIEVLAAHTTALDEHADAMDNLKKALYFEGDMRGRGR
jgi:hypothetical protein